MSIPLSGEGSREVEANDLGQNEPSFLDLLDEYEYIIAPLLFTFLAFFTRLWKIGLSPIVTWDEAQ